MTGVPLQAPDLSTGAAGTDGDARCGAGARHVLPPALLHDLRSPLNQILGYSQMMIEQAQEEQHNDCGPDLRKVHEAGLQLLQLIESSFCSALTPDPAVAVSSAERDAGAGPLVEELAESASATARGILLVVDDNAANREVLSRQLKRQGYTVATAESGRRALAEARARPLDIVLLDIMMPEMDGYQVLQQLKADEALRHIPVIMVSALSELESVVRCIKMGAEDYLTKPFEPTLLKARVGACLEKKRAHDREVRFTNELQASYRRLQQLEQLRDDLTHMIVHDLRTPLTSVMAGIQTLEVVGDLSESQQELIGIALDSGQTLLGMINDLLDVDKMESGAMQLEHTLLVAADLVATAVVQVARLAEAGRVTLVQEIAADLPPFEGDQDTLRRVLVNLLGNAIKFSPTDGTVTVAALKGDDGRSVQFAVRDTGEGIPPEAYLRIFEKFGQVESRQAGRKMSTGLGLAFCRLAVRAHGGHLWVVSKLGKGSTFSFIVPLGS